MTDYSFLDNIGLFYVDYENQNQQINNLTRGLAHKYIKNSYNVSNFEFSFIKDKVKTLKLIVIDASIFQAGLLESKQSRYLSFPNLKDPSYYQEVFDFLMNCLQIKVYIGLAHDIHWPGIDLNYLCKKIECIAWIHHFKPSNFKQLTSSPFFEEWGVQHGNAEENWNLVQSSVKSSIELLWAPEKICKANHKKIFDIAVVGSPYKTRVEAIKQIQRSDLTYPYYEKGSYLIEYIQRCLPLSPVFNHFIIKLRRANQNLALKYSQAGFACGSFLKYPTAKFFEIPACKSLLMAYPCHRFNHYGFIDGLNCIATEPQDIVLQYKDVFKNPENAEKIKMAGIKLIEEKHLLSKRVLDFLNCLKVLMSGKNIRACFVDGKFEITPH